MAQTPMKMKTIHSFRKEVKIMRPHLDTVETRGGIEKRLDRIENLAHALISLVDELRDYVKRQQTLAARIPKRREPLDLTRKEAKTNEEPA